MIIAEGGAWARIDTPAETDLREAQEIAKSKQLGLWASEAVPMSPSEYRKRQQVALRQKQARRKAPQPVNRKVDNSKSYWLNTKTGNAIIEVAVGSEKLAPGNTALQTLALLAAYARAEPNESASTPFLSLSLQICV